SAELAINGYTLGAAFWEDRGARLASGAVLALTAGIGKELYDLSGHGDASWKDFTWDVIGTATGLLISWLVGKYPFRREPPGPRPRRPFGSSPTVRRGAVPPRAAGPEPTALPCGFWCSRMPTVTARAAVRPDTTSAVQGDGFGDSPPWSGTLLLRRIRPLNTR